MCFLLLNRSLSVKVGQRRALSEVPNPNGEFQAGVNPSALQTRDPVPAELGPWSVISGCRSLNVDVELQDGQRGSANPRLDGL